MAALIQEIVIRSEDDAYRYLDAAVQGELGRLAGHLTAVRFEGWPTLRIHVTGPKFDQSITPSMMHGFVELQRNLYRSYAIARYNSPSIRSLTKEERKALEIEIRVEGGSSDFEVDLTELLGKMIELVGGRMDSMHLLILLLGIATLFGGHSAFRIYLQTRKEIREREIANEDRRAHLDALRFAGEQETRRAAIISALVERNPQMDNLERAAHDAKTALVKSVGRADANDAEIQGVDLDGETAAELARNARSRSEEVRLDGDYRIFKVDSSRPGAFKVLIKSVISTLKVEATVQDAALNDEAKRILQEAEWGRLAVRLKVNARQIRDDIKDAVIIDVERAPIPLVDGNRPADQ